MNRTLGYLALAAIVLVAGYFAWMTTHRGSTLAGPAVATSTAPITVSTSTIEAATDVYTIDAAYSQFGIPAIDAAVQSDIQKAVDELKAYPPAYRPSDVPVPKNELVARYEDVYTGSDVISVKLVIMEYTGGAHPITAFNGDNFDRTTGRRLTLDDAEKMTGLSLSQIATQATAKLKATLGDAMFPEGATADPNNYASFLVSKDAVTFIFQQYQVAAYAAGPQEVSFPRVY